MLEEVLQHLNNWFLVPDGIHSGEFTVQDGGPLLGEPRASQAGRDGQLFARSYWRWCCGRPTESDPFAKPEGMSLSRR